MPWIVALTTATLILAVVLWHLLSLSAASQPPLASLSSGSPTRSAALAVANNAPCAAGGTASKRPSVARQETTLELDLSQGGKPHEVTLIVPATELTFFSDGRLTTAHHLALGDRVLITGDKVGLVRKAATAWYTPPPVPTRDANGNVVSRVIATSKRLTDQMLYLYTASDIIKTTPEHPFFVQDRGWVEAAHLQYGNRVQTQVGSFVTIEGSELRNEQEMVYNLTVEGTNNFYVGKERLLAHNCAYSFLQPSKRRLGDLQPLHAPGMNPTTEGVLQRMSDQELLESVMNPADGRLLRVRPGGIVTIDGNTRLYEMQRRMQQNPNGPFHQNLEIPVFEEPKAPLDPNLPNDY
jgi:hypothetical protein